MVLKVEYIEIYRIYKIYSEIERERRRDYKVLQILYEPLDSLILDVALNDTTLAHHPVDGYEDQRQLRLKTHLHYIECNPKPLSKKNK